MFPQVQNRVTPDSGLASNVETQLDDAHGKFGSAGAEHLMFDIFVMVQKDLTLRFVGMKNGTDPVMGCDAVPIHHCRFDEFVVNAAAIAMFRDVAFGVLEKLEKAFFEILAQY